MLYVIFLILIGYFLIQILTNFYEKKRLISDDGIKKLIRQTARWSVASEQDANPMIKVLHANYSVGYLNALLDVSDKHEINNAMGNNFDFNQFNDEIIKNQDNSTKHLSSVCPGYIPKNIYLTRIAGEAFYSDE